MAKPVDPVGSDVGATDDTQMPTRPSGELAEPVVRERGGQRDADYDVLVTVEPTHYIVGDELARGGMGRIFEARDRRLGRTVAIKELLVRTDDLRVRFEREARITAKLQHPNIVNVLEAGTWPNGEPFYAMKLVAGRSLDKEIAARPTLAERLALIPYVIAVVDALAYAHSRRVIHRDLKPSNVLVGQFGETVVIDWGLAKDLADGSDPETGPFQRSSPRVDETESGSVMGTPSYMPVEQARGAAVDERADVYSLGAILYHVLAGEAPFVGRDSVEILAAVTAGPPPALETRVADVPPDLVAIVKRAMAYDAADRYPTAQGLADDLKRFQTGQLVGAHRYTAAELFKRWLGRHRRVVAVAGVAAILLTVLGSASVYRIVVERQRTEQQRREAVRVRGEAESLLAFMLGDLQPRLTAVGRLDLLDVVAKKAFAYYDSNGPLGDDVLGRAIAERSLGVVLAAEGNADAALREQRDALATIALAAGLAPYALRLQSELADSYVSIAKTLHGREDTKAVVAELEHALHIDAALVVAQPELALWREKLADVHDEIGSTLFDAADIGGARDHFHAAIELREQLVASSATDAAIEALAASRERFGDAERQSGDTAAAHTEYALALTTRVALVSKNPYDADRQRALAWNRIRTGDMALAQGKAAAALVEFRAAHEILATLAAQDPISLLRQNELALSYARIGDALTPQGDVGGALAQYSTARAILESLMARDPSSKWQEALARQHEEIAGTLMTDHRLDEALAELRTASKLYTALLVRSPDNASWQRGAALANELVGDIELQHHDVASALAAYRAVLANARAIAAVDPQAVEKKHLVASAELKVGNALTASGDLAGAQSLYREALALSVENVAADPGNRDLEPMVYAARTKLGDIALGQHDPGTALKDYRSALELERKLVAVDPSRTDLWADLVGGNANVARALVANGESAEALKECRAAVASAAASVAADPHDIDPSFVLASFHETCGEVLAAMHDTAPARVEYQAAISGLRAISATADVDEALRNATAKLAELRQ